MDEKRSGTFLVCGSHLKRNEPVVHSRVRINSSDEGTTECCLQESIVRYRCLRGAAAAPTLRGDSISMINELAGMRSPIGRSSYSFKH